MSGKAGRPFGTTGFKKAQRAAMRDPSQQFMSKYIVNVANVVNVVGPKGSLVMNFSGGPAPPAAPAGPACVGRAPEPAAARDTPGRAAGAASDGTGRDDDEEGAPGSGGGVGGGASEGEGPAGTDGGGNFVAGAAPVEARNHAGGSGAGRACVSLGKGSKRKRLAREEGNPAQRPLSDLQPTLYTAAQKEWCLGVLKEVGSSHEAVKRITKVAGYEKVGRAQLRRWMKLTVKKKQGR